MKTIETLLEQSGIEFVSVYGTDTNHSELVNVPAYDGTYIYTTVSGEAVEFIVEEGEFWELEYNIL